MPTVTFSTFKEDGVEADGRRRITERHLIDDGRDFTFTYLADQDVDPNVVLTARAERLQTELAAREKALIEAQNGDAPLTEMEFRRRFTIAERRRVDRFNARFETDPMLTEEQKDVIRTGLLDLRAAQGVSLQDPLTIAGVMLYETLGLLDSGRAAEILNG